MTPRTSDATMVLLAGAQVGGGKNLLGFIVIANTREAYFGVLRDNL